MSISTCILTKKGQALLAKTPIGAEIPVTRWQIGTGVLPAEQMEEDMTALVVPLQYIPISSISHTANKATVLGQFVNTGLPEFVWEELGLWATDPDEGEVLYAVGEARGNGEPIEDGAVKFREFIFGMELVFDHDVNITTVIDSSLIFATLEQLKERIPYSEKGQPNGVASLDESGKVLLEQLPAMGISSTVVDFTASEWTGGKLTLSKERHGRSSGVFLYRLYHQVNGKLTGNTWAVQCTDVTYDSATESILLTCGDAYDGQITLFS